jgi:hypothetical protein
MKTGTAIGIGCGVLAVLGLGCLGVFGLLGWWGVGQIKALDQGADSFLAQLGAGEIDGAYKSAAEALRRQQTPEQFAAAVKKLGLTEFQSASWTTRKVSNAEGTMVGTIITRGGGTVPLTVNLLREGEVWRVSGLSSSAAGVVTTPGTTVLPAERPVPPEGEAQALAKRTLLDLGTAVRTGDYAALQRTLSRRWQDEVSPEKLQEILHDLADKKADLGSEAEVKPVFDRPPTIDEKGWLVLEGHYPLPDRRVTFRLKYLYEDPAWKPVGFKVDVGK